MSRVNYGNSDDLEAGQEKATASIGGVGKLLHDMKGKEYTTWYCKSETTTLEFYEHVVVARITSKLWCFPERYFCQVIPRFKITGAAFSKGPQGMPKLLVGILAVIGIILVMMGLSGGSCSAGGGKCALTIFGFVVLCLFLPIVIIVSWLQKERYVLLTTKFGSAGFLSRGGTHTTAYLIGSFERDNSKQTFFDEGFLVDYIYGSLGKGGNMARDEAHVLAHFNDASLAAPMVPIYADKISEIVPRIIQRKNGGNGGSGADRAPPYSPRYERNQSNAKGGKSSVVSPPRARPARTPDDVEVHYTPEESDFDAEETRKAMKHSPYG